MCSMSECYSVLGLSVLLLCVTVFPQGGELTKVQEIAEERFMSALPFMPQLSLVRNVSGDGIQKAGGETRNAGDSIWNVGDGMRSPVARSGFMVPRWGRLVTG